MITERVYRVAYVETNRDEEDIRFTFAQCGEIRGIYPLKTGDRHKSVHFFVEFGQHASVKRARALQLRDVKVHILAYSPELIEHFEALAPPSDAPARDRYQPLNSRGHVMRPWSQGPGKPYSPKPFSVKRGNRKAGRKDNQAHSGWGFRSDSTPGAGSSGDQNKENYGDALQGSTSTLTFPNPPPSMDGLPSVICTASPASESVKVKTESAPSSPIRRGPPTPIKANLPSRPPSAAHILPSPVIILTYGGDRFHCQLDQLSDDPENVITLLTQTCAQALERDKWMIVAGYYRNKGNVKSALSVVTAMLNVMTSVVGLSEAELKPAHLMLAGCHSDLSKSASSADLAKEHITKAQEYLHKIYGANVPRITESFTSPVVDVRGQNSHRGYFANASNMSTGESTFCSGDTHRKTAADDARLRILEREAQSLRDRHNNVQANLAQARAAGRELEDDLAAERDARRKAERELGDAMGELSGARRGEKYAIEQCKREVESRRRVEERMAELRDEVALLRRELGVKDKEMSERERRTREVVGELGELFTRASKGEADLPTIWARSVHSLPPSVAPPKRGRTTSAHSRSDDRSGLAA